MVALGLSGRGGLRSFVVGGPWPLRSEMKMAHSWGSTPNREQKGKLVMSILVQEPCRGKVRPISDVNPSFAPVAMSWRLADICGDPYRQGFQVKYVLASSALDAVAIDEMYALAKIIESKNRHFQNSSWFIIKPLVTTTIDAIEPKGAGA